MPVFRFSRERWWRAERMSVGGDAAAEQWCGSFFGRPCAGLSEPRFGADARCAHPLCAHTLPTAVVKGAGGDPAGRTNIGVYPPFGK